MSQRKDVVPKDGAAKKIRMIQMGTMDFIEMQKASELQVFDRQLYRMPARTPAPNGCLDTRLGVSDKVSTCQTCKKKLTDCAGHFGYIHLELPVYHVGYFKHTISILQCICKTCSRVLLPVDERAVVLRKMRNPKMGALMKAALFKKTCERCKKVSQCPYCGAVNGVVKKIPNAALKIVHEKFRAKNAGDEIDAHLEDLEEVLEQNKELQPYASKVQELITPWKALRLFQNILDEDCELLWMTPEFGRPENLILSAIPVPPVPIRPSVPMDVGGGSNEDDITVKLQEILEVNKALKIGLAGGVPMKSICENVEFLQIQVAQLINGDTPGLTKLSGSKPIRGFSQRLKGKQGRFRGNLSGKRVDFSGRTVISPDPNLSVHQVGVPIHVAKIMTYPERVNKYNIQKVRQLVRNGPDVYPGANFIRPAGGGFPKSLMYGDRNKLANDLRIGDIVERHMEDDDIVLFNRQPSLHKMSIMAHRAKVMPWRTFRFNECVCSPYNADFDGDEMNMHLPQTEEARAEAAMLMAVPYNLVTPRNAEPLVAATQDFLTGAYLITQKDVYFTREQFAAVAAYLGDADEHIDMPLPAILKPRELWTGKQIISLLVRPNKECDALVNLENKERHYSSGKYMCPHDGYVCFRNGELMSGCLGKKTLGGGSKSGLYCTLIRNHGVFEATRCMNRLAKLCGRYLGGHRGFSIGIDDVTPSPKVQAMKQAILVQGYTDADKAISQYHAGNLKLKPGCNAIQSLESDLNGLLGKIRESCGQEAMKALPWSNSPRIMAECGSKGSSLNISQMVACVGQQAVGGQRIQDGFMNRTLPHFPPGSLFPAAKGFVANSFYSGLTATEFFFHTMGGREGLVDTAVKTAETGYMARRLMKALEDLSLQYDGTVRNSELTVVQFSYGDDGLNPQYMEGDDRPVDFQKLLLQVVSEDESSDQVTMSSAEVLEFGEETVNRPEFQRLLPEGALFLDEIRGFCRKIANNLMPLEAPGIPDAKTIRAKLRKMTPAELREWQRKARETGTMPELETRELIRDNAFRITRRQLETVMTQALDRYLRAIVEPGEAVGAVGAQSISEPGTQMTLKTFHFAGVASMNVTLGVPRLKEIINASKAISTPIITAQLVQNDNKTSARIVKAQIEKTLLGEIAEAIEEVYSPDMVYINIRLDMNAIQNLHLNVDSRTVRASILQSAATVRAPVLRQLKDKHVLIPDGSLDTLRVIPPEPKDQKGIPAHRKLYFTVQALKSALPDVIVQGIPSVSRAVINEEAGTHGDGKVRYHLLVEGYGLADVMGAPGIKGSETKSNHIIEVEHVLGIEAARRMISEEISYIMSAYGITIDKRHLMLLSDVMTFKGEVLGITRFGVAKMRESVLMLASFEKTTDHLFDAAVHSRADSIVGVSECIIMGVPIPLGTGLFKLLHKGTSDQVTGRRVRLFERATQELRQRTQS